MQRFFLRALQNDGGSRGFLTANIFDKDVVHLREMMIVHAFARIFRSEEKEVFHLSEFAIVYENVADETAAIGIGFEVDTAFAITGVGAIFDEYIFDTRRHFATQHHGVQTLELTIADDDIGRGTSFFASVVVAAALDGHVVIAIVEDDVLDEYILGVFRIDAVVVGQLRIVAQTVADDVFRLEQVHAPERRLGDENIFQGDSFAVEELNELWTQIIAFAKIAFFHRRALVVVLAAQVFALLLLFAPFGKTVGGITIDGAFSYDADVVLSVGVDERTVIVDKSAFPTGLRLG